MKKKSLQKIRLLPVCLKKSFQKNLEWMSVWVYVMIKRLEFLGNSIAQTNKRVHQIVLFGLLDPNTTIWWTKTGADPGFPMGGVDPFWWGVDLRCRPFSVKMYVKTKELGPMGEGGVRRKILYVDSPMKKIQQNVLCPYSTVWWTFVLFDLFGLCEFPKSSIINRETMNYCLNKTFI